MLKIEARLGKTENQIASNYYCEVFSWLFVSFSFLGEWGKGGGGVDTSPFKLTVIDQVSGKNLPQSLDICFFVDIAFSVYSTLFIQITFH